MKLSNRLSKIPEYAFTRLDTIKQTLKEKNIDVIDLGIGDPDLKVPNYILENMSQFINNEAYHKYPPSTGLIELKKAIAKYYLQTYKVNLNYEDEVAILIGSKEGIAHLFLAITDPNDYVLLPNPAYPVYYSAALISSLIPYKVPLSEKNGYLPNLSCIYKEVASKAKLFIINYPNNPTGAIANRAFYEEIVEFSKTNNIIIANDGAYMDICNDSLNAISLLEVNGAKENCIEFGTFSKLYSMTGFRIGYVVGSKEVIKELLKVKNNFDSGQFLATQAAAAIALSTKNNHKQRVNNIYNERRESVTKVLKEKGLDVYDSKGAFYIWFKVPNNFKSEEFAEFLLKNTGIIITPGSFFGDLGEGFCRLSLTAEDKLLSEALYKIKSLKF